MTTNGMDLRTKAAELRAAASSLVAKADALDEYADKIEAEMAGVDALLSGVPVSVAGMRGRKPGSKATAKKGDSKRAKNETSLKSLIMTILKENKSGLDLPSLVEKCIQRGYKSNTKGSFSGIVYQNLYKLIKDEKSVEKDDESKKYKLAKAA